MSERKTLKYFLLKSTVGAILDSEESWLVLEFIRCLCLKVCLHPEKLLAAKREKKKLQGVNVVNFGNVCMQYSSK